MTKKRRTEKPTRVALINAGLHLFGEQGFDATSTRQIAQAAEANISAISYYFGGKQGLRFACAEHAVEMLTDITNARLPEIRDLDQQGAGLALEHILSGLVNMLLQQPQAKDLSQFILREVAQAGAVLDAMFPEFIEPTHKSLCELWARATGQGAESEAVILTLFSLLGQVVYFRVGQDIVNKRMGWDSVGPEQAAMIESVIRANLRATLKLAKKGSDQ